MLTLRILAHALKRVVFFLALAVCAPVSAQNDTLDEATGTVPSISAFAAAQNTELDEADLAVLMVPLSAEELSKVASIWLGELRSILDEAAILNLALKNADEAQAKELRARLSKVTKEQFELKLLYELVLDNWERKGASEEDLQQHHRYLNAVYADSLLTTDAESLMRFLMGWLFSVDGGLGLLLKLAGVVFAIWAMMFAARFTRNTASKALEKVPTMSRLLKTFVLTALYWSTYAVGIVVALSFFGVNVTPLFAVVGGVSFILGFALQETLGNLASGLMIMVLKPFDAGDQIQTSGVLGFVDEMSIVSTKIRTFDNKIMTVPNSKIWNDVITNVSASDVRRVDLIFGIAYSDKASEAIEALQDLIENHGLCLGSPEAEVFVGELGDSSVNIFCRPWCKSEDYWDVYWELTGQAKERFDAEGISIPFPQRDVHLHQFAQEKGP